MKIGRAGHDATVGSGERRAGPGGVVRSPVLFYCAVALAAAVLLAVVVPFGGLPLRVPYRYGGDATLLLALVKGVAEDGPFHLTRVGAPFGADIVDWPLGMWLPLLGTSVVVRLTGEPGLALNLLWLGATVLTAVTATWALVRLDHRRDVAFVFGLLYAFLPYGFYRNVEHANLVFPLVPPLALLCLRAAGRTGAAPWPRGERRVAFAACVAQGLCFIYYSFFAAGLLAVAVALGWARTRRADLARGGAAGLLLLALGAALPLVPSAVYWSRHGRNEELQYKRAADADHYGLKLRHLVTPIADHPLPAFRAVASAVERAGFPDENENATARLGTLGSLGLVLLLGFAIARAAGAVGPHDSLGAASALTVAALLVAGVGGLGSIFNLLVAPDVRGYNRIVVFIAFFCAHAAASGVSWLLGRGRASRLSGPTRALVLGVLAVAGVADQVPRGFLAAARGADAGAYAEDGAFVAQVEGVVPEGGMVFQLPHGSIPLDPVSKPPMQIYDPGHAFIHSRTLRWSWGSVIGRGGHWQAQVSRLSAGEMARRLALAGFAGIWIDRWGYPDTAPLPGLALEAALASAAGSGPLVSARGRYSFVPLEGLRGLLAGRLGPAALEAARAGALGDFVLFPRWREGCSDEEGAVDRPSRVCGPRAWAVLKNDEARELRLLLSAELRALRPGRVRIAGEGFADELALEVEPARYRREITIGPQRRLRLELTFDGPCEGGGSGPRCIEVFDMRAATAGPP